VSAREETRLPLNRIRRATAKAMRASADVPQFTLDRDVATASLTELRARHKDAGLPGTISDFLVAACAHALRDHPHLNASFDDDSLVLHPDVNVGTAVALDDGLIVPCVVGADRRSLAELAAERQRLDAAARAGSLKPNEIFATTFTISNLGPLGVDRFRALVTPPQAAILAVGRFGETVSLALSCDHRAVDGAPAARFLATIATRLEETAWLEDL
jgi:pyruvate dehydrogenase E2 component (dihydrolipoamide acetyltransferase)